jgi:hypothetical protein
MTKRIKNVPRQPLAWQTGVHPLNHPNIAQLVEGSGDTFWSLNGMVIGPIQALQILGVDIYADDRYETRVLRTLWHDLLQFHNSINFLVGVKCDKTLFTFFFSSTYTLVDNCYRTCFRMYY